MSCRPGLLFADAGFDFDVDRRHFALMGISGASRDG
jgi:hypothetical protein